MSSNDGKICYKFDSDALLARELLDMGLYMGLYGQNTIWVTIQLGIYILSGTF